jgi:hypothetical protein
MHSRVEQLDQAFQLELSSEVLVDWLELPKSAGQLRCIGARCPSEPPVPYLPQRKWLKYMGPQTQFAVWAAGRALEDARVIGKETEPEAARRGMALYLTTGPIAFELTDVLPGLFASRGPEGKLDFGAVGGAGLRATSPMMPFHTLLNMPVGLVSMVFGIKGQNAIFYPDAEQSLFALSAGFRSIRHDRTAMAMVGGTAHVLSFMPIATLSRRGQLAPSVDAAIPFGPCHQGWAVGDAAAMLVLEREDHARSRGARIYGSIEVEPTLQSSEELIAEALAAPKDARVAAVTIVTGTANTLDDNVARHVAQASRILSLDSVFGFNPAASLVLSVAAGCRLLEHPGLLRGQQWHANGKVDVLVCVPVAGGKSRWGKVRLEAVA